MENLLKLHLQRRRNGEKVGICSVCSANPFVLEAALEHGKENDSLVLIEATANQVNQFGGYTGKQPVDFINEVYAMADAKGFPREKLILGGDHLGPLTWQKEPEESAMAKAETLVKLFVLAGYTKIHIDTSMRVADDDPNAALDVAVVARRSARLAKACKEAYEERKAANPDAVEPVYVVGSEVPIPGGAQEPEEGVQVTSVADFKNTVSVFKAAYDAAGLQVRIDRDRAHILEPVFLQVAADPRGQAVRDRDARIRMPAVKNGLPLGEGPEVRGQRPELVPDLLRAAGIRNDRLDLPPGAKHVFRVQYALDVSLAQAGNAVNIKVIETFPEDLPLLQHEVPAQPALEALEREVLEHGPVVADRNAPLTVMIYFQPLVRVGPFTAAHRRSLMPLLRPSSASSRTSGSSKWRNAGSAAPG